VSEGSRKKLASHDLKLEFNLFQGVCRMIKMEKPKNQTFLKMKKQNNKGPILL